MAVNYRMLALISLVSADVLWGCYDNSEAPSISCQSYFLQDLSNSTARTSCPLGLCAHNSDLSSCSLFTWYQCLGIPQFESDSKKNTTFGCHEYSQEANMTCSVDGCPATRCTFLNDTKRSHLCELITSPYCYGPSWNSSLIMGRFNSSDPFNTVQCSPLGCPSDRCTQYNDSSIGGFCKLYIDHMSEISSSFTLNSPNNVELNASPATTLFNVIHIYY